MKRLRNFFSRHHWSSLYFGAFLLTMYYGCIPAKLFNDPLCTVITDKNGTLLGAKIASDGQWRFPPRDTVPSKFAIALTTFEDKRFYSHWGVDAQALGRAFWQNTSRMKRVSGASTLTMQVIRLSRKGQSRSIFEKLIELTMATRLEWSYSKAEILSMYASNAPFGGNVVGLDAAAWKYYGRDASKLTWAEAATLAVLPNSPALIHPGRNRDILRAKRDGLLNKLCANGNFSPEECNLFKMEPLPAAPKPLPMFAPHLLERLAQQQNKEGKPHAVVKTTLDINLQQSVTAIASRHHSILEQNEIHNLAIILTETETGNVLAYIGNAPKSLYEEDERSNRPPDGESVDCTLAPRSTGSILKPLLYACAVQDGTILPKSLLPDVPAQYGGYTPKNFDQTYDGAVQADVALARSLNIPFVYLLNQYGLSKFHNSLRKMGMSTLNFVSTHYGLTLILGGAEANLWELTGIYASIGRTLTQFRRLSSRYAADNFHGLNLVSASSNEKPNESLKAKNESIIGAAAAWQTLNAMQELVRPEQEGYWQRFASAKKIAWKTGTSYGYRDAWAIGVTPKYTVGVWVGNADGEPRPGLIGVQAAAPILFEVFGLLPASEWFDPPYDDMTESVICRESGHLAGDHCPNRDTVWLPKKSLQTKSCPYHQAINLDPSGTWRVHGDCESPQNMVQRTYFMLPPAQEHFYKNHHPDYVPLPNYRSDCSAAAQSSTKRVMELLYPKPSTRIFIPKDFSEKKSRTVFEAAHRNADAVIFWHLDKDFIGKTQHFHQISVQPSIGKHTVTLVDENGETIVREFEIVGK